MQKCANLVALDNSKILQNAHLLAIFRFDTAEIGPRTKAPKIYEIMQNSGNVANFARHAPLVPKEPGTTAQARRLLGALERFERDETEPRGREVCTHPRKPFPRSGGSDASAAEAE